MKPIRQEETVEMYAHLIGKRVIKRRSNKPFKSGEKVCDLLGLVY